jgi:hypothetical protein
MHRSEAKNAGPNTRMQITSFIPLLLRRGEQGTRWILYKLPVLKGSKTAWVLELLIFILV